MPPPTTITFGRDAMSNLPEFVRAPIVHEFIAGPGAFRAISLTGVAHGIHRFSREYHRFLQFEEKIFKLQEFLLSWMHDRA
jgi:hypothetical protein